VKRKQLGIAGGLALSAGLLIILLRVIVVLSVAHDAYEENRANKPIEYAPTIYGDRWEDGEGFMEFTWTGVFNRGDRAGKVVTGTHRPWNEGELLIELDTGVAKKSEKLKIKLDRDKLTTWDERGKKRVLTRKKQG
jgi:hypothetical protein